MSERNITIIAAGPVIIEDGKVLLNREKKPYGSSLFMFPGGTVDPTDVTLEDACRREVKEEAGIDINIIRPLRTLMLPRPEKEDETVILAHFLAERIGDVTPGEGILECNWFDIRSLPENCAPNVHEIIQNIIDEKDS